MLCEDTRHTAILLRHYNIARPTASYNAHDVRSKVPWVLEQLRAGKTVALVSDAGTPGISDPGTLLARAALDAGFAVERGARRERDPDGAGALGPAHRPLRV